MKRNMFEDASIILNQRTADFIKRKKVMLLFGIRFANLYL